MTGWGQDGPQAQTAGHDINYIAVTGALHADRTVPRFPSTFLAISVAAVCIWYWASCQRCSRSSAPVEARRLTSPSSTGCHTC
jgi:hypothetical protein